MVGEEYVCRVSTEVNLLLDPKYTIASVWTSAAFIIQSIPNKTIAKLAVNIQPEISPEHYLGSITYYLEQPRVSSSFRWRDGLDKRNGF